MCPLISPQTSSYPCKAPIIIALPVCPSVCKRIGLTPGVPQNGFLLNLKLEKFNENCPTTTV
jgi:hypothetical protein